MNAPGPHRPLRMRGWYKYTTWLLCLLVIGFALYMIPNTLELGGLT